MELKIELKANFETSKELFDKDKNATGRQLQFTQIGEDKNGDVSIELITIKVNKVFTDAEMAKFEGKALITDSSMGLQEFSFDFGQKGYACDDIKLVSKTFEEGFSLRNSIIGVAKAVNAKTSTNPDTKEEVKSTIFTMIEKVNGVLKINKIKVKLELENYKDYIGKEVSFENLNITKMNMKTYISSLEAPKLV